MAVRVFDKTIGSIRATVMTYTLSNIDRNGLWKYFALTMLKMQQTGKRTTTTLRMRNDEVSYKFDIRLSITPVELSDLTNKEV